MSAVFKRDFRGFFVSPLGYVYVGAFIFVMNLYFYFSNILFQNSGVSGIFDFMLLVMVFTTPILTMRVFADDFRQKTDQLLLTSPVSLTSIVLGKFMAVLSVFGCVIALSLLWPLIISIFGEPNIVEILGNYLSITAIACVYLSIGIFVSSLTENQLVAAVGSLGIFISFLLLDVAVANINAMPEWIRKALSFISVFGRFDAIRLGVFNVSDLLFFLSFGTLFLFLAVRVLEKKRWG